MLGYVARRGGRAVDRLPARHRVLAGDRRDPRGLRRQRGLRAPGRAAGTGDAVRAGLDGRAGRRRGGPRAQRRRAAGCSRSCSAPCSSSGGGRCDHARSRRVDDRRSRLARPGRPRRGRHGRADRRGQGRHRRASSTIAEINAGMYAFDAAWLRRRIGDLRPSPTTGELYLTDLVAVRARGRRGSSTALDVEDDGRLLGINDRPSSPRPSGDLRARDQRRATCAPA